MESVGSELSKSPSVTDRANLDSFNFSVLGLHVGDQVNNTVGVAHLIVIPAKNIWMVKKYFRWNKFSLLWGEAQLCLPYDCL